MSDLVAQWKQGRREFWTEDTMYVIGDRLAARLEAAEREATSWRHLAARAGEWIRKFTPSYQRNLWLDDFAALAQQEADRE